MDSERAPRIVVTVAAPRDEAHAAVLRPRIELYLDGVRRAGGEPMALDERASPEEREHAFAGMAGLLLTGGADLDPALYGQTLAGSEPAQPGRDALERQAWDAARAAGVPILGICRGFQVINVFAGGALVQHIDGHRRPGAPLGEEPTHEMVLRPETRLAEILSDGRAGSDQPLTLTVNSSHHQAVRPDQLGAGLRIAGESGELVEALEAEDRAAWVIGVQCHPERTANTPPEFDRLWRAFVTECAARLEPVAERSAHST